MGDNIVVNVDIEGCGTVTTAVQAIPLDIQWADFELMLKLTAENEGSDIDVYYKDDEDEFVKVNSQEELQIALTIAQSAESPLNMKVICRSDHSGSTSPSHKQKPVTDTDCSGATGASGGLSMAAARCAQPDVWNRKYFFLKHAASGLVLDVKEYSKKPGTQVILFGKKKSGCGNQLWFFDEDTQTIRSKFCSLCLEISESGSKVEIYKAGCPDQTWKVEGSRIQHVSRAGLVVGVRGDKATQGALVRACEDKSDKGLDWTMEHVSCQPALHPGFCPMAAPSSHQYYSDLAQSMCQLLQGVSDQTSTGQVGGASGTAQSDGQAKAPPTESPQSESPQSECPQQPTPPQWLLDLVKGVQKNMIEEVSDAVANKTVSKVLQGLEGAVIASVPGSTGIMQPPRTAGGVQTGERTKYHHVGVVCDVCEKSIVGVRYKCGNCEDYDLCSDCEATNLGSVHPADHVFLKIYKPVMNAGRKKDGGMMALLKHNIYTQTERVQKEQQAPKPCVVKKQEVKQMTNQRPQYKDPIEKLKRKQEKLRKKVEKTEEKIKKKEKRRLEQEEASFGKKEKLELPQFRVPDRMDAEFVRDATIPDGTKLEPGEKFCKKWVVKNTGTSPWTDGTRLMMIWGNMKPVQEEIEVPYTEVGHEITIQTDMLAPHEPGTYQSHWRLAYCGLRFGQRVWCSIVVDAKAAENRSRSPIRDLDIPTQKECDEQETVQQGPGEERDEADGGSNAIQQIEEGKGEAQGGPQKSPKRSQTATPNNTPLESRDPSPPHSPPAELESERIWSLSSTPSFPESSEASGLLTAEALSQHMAKMDLQPPDIDLESLDSLSSTSSEDTDEEFYVVPIPDCFNPKLPPSTSTSTSLLVKKEELAKAEESEDAVETTPLLSADETDYQPMANEEDPSSNTEENQATANTDIPVEPAQAEATNQSAEESQPIGEPETKEEAVTESKSEAGDVAQVPEICTDSNQEITPAVPVIEVRERSEEVRERSEEVKGQPEPQAPGAVGSPGNGSSNAAVASQLVATVMDIATKATATAANTAKGVFDTLQGRSQFEPPQSQWTPPEDTWSPPSPAQVPVTPQWTPPVASVTGQPKAPATPMEKLMEMGFPNRQQNEELLRRHNNDLEKVIQELVSSNSLDWHVNRH